MVSSSVSGEVYFDLNIKLDRWGRPRAAYFEGRASLLARLALEAFGLFSCVLYAFDAVLQQFVICLSRGRWVL